MVRREVSKLVFYAQSTSAVISGRCVEKMREVAYYGKRHLRPFSEVQQPTLFIKCQLNFKALQTEQKMSVFRTQLLNMQ